MARIRHIALATRDPEATKRFYIEGLGLKEVGKVNTPTSEGYYLSDGHVNLAILRFKYDEPAKTEGHLALHRHPPLRRGNRGHVTGPGTDRKSRRRAPSLPRNRRDGEAGKRRGQIHRTGRRDHRSLRARLARHEVIKQVLRDHLSP